MYETGEKVIHEIRQLRADRKGQYSQPFIFKKKVSFIYFLFYIAGTK